MFYRGYSLFDVFANSLQISCNDLPLFVRWISLSGATADNFGPCYFNSSSEGFLNEEKNRKLCNSIAKHDMMSLEEQKLYE